MVTRESVFKLTRELGYPSYDDLFILHRWLVDNGIICLVTHYYEATWTHNNIQWEITMYNKKDKTSQSVSRIGFKTYEDAFLNVLVDGLKEKQKNDNQDKSNKLN